MCTLAWVVALYFTNGKHCGEAKGPVGEMLGTIGAWSSICFCMLTDILVLTLLRQLTGY